jgi:dipeptidyl aminopeptidase/acylaminoacyl peptidase
MWFPEDNHSIDRPASEVEQWMAALAWIEKYFKD